MTAPVTTFADLTAPLSPAEFLGTYHGKRPIHIPGAPEKFASVMGWGILSDLLAQGRLWPASSLQLVLDTRTVEVPEYCRPVPGGPPMADLTLVAQWLRRGATLVLNDIDGLTPGLRSAASALEAGVGGKAQANLYCSRKSRQAIDSHFDTHDVYALHIAGEKRWRVYDTPAPNPVSHPAFKSHGHDARAGGRTVAFEIVMRPGDLLYLPRGWYHDALAETPGTIHVAFGVTTVVGLDLVTLLFERAVHEELFRRSVPSPDAENGDALARHMATLGERLAAFAAEPAVIERFRAFVKGYRYQRPELTLPDDIVEPRWARRTPALRVARAGASWVLSDGSKGVPIPPGMEKPVSWMLDQPSFSESELAAAFPALGAAGAERLLKDLAAMTVIAPA